MELFNTTGFEVGDKVFKLIDDKKYLGVVVKVDDRLSRIKVNYSAKGEKVINWFQISFWKKVE